MKNFRGDVNREITANYPERVLQIGEGNFMRGFIDWMIFDMNQKTDFNGRVVTIQPTPRGKIIPKLNSQNGLYTLVRRGIENGKPVEHIEIIDSISRGINPYSDWQEALEVARSEQIEFLFSNTTEAGLTYEKEDFLETESPFSFPGKVVALLYHRYKNFDGASDKGWTIIPCELIEKNGEELQRICLQIIADWNLPYSFCEWLKNSCTFCNTLVDRIVPGYPNDEAEEWFDRLGYTDELLTIAEPYHLFVIEGPEELREKLPFIQSGLNVRLESISAYRNLKVKLLNAPHTIMTVIGLQLGIETVKEAVEDPLLGEFVKQVMRNEIACVLPKDEQKQIDSYISETMDRFSNPFLQHLLKDISLNSFAKFHVRVWPLIEEAKEENRDKLIFSLAALITMFHNSEGLKDDQKVTTAFDKFYKRDYTNQNVLKDFIVMEIFNEWQQDEMKLSNIANLVIEDVRLIQQLGMREALSFKLK